MALLKLKIAPTLAGYTAAPGDQVITTVLDGGAPRQRQDIIGASAAVAVRWVVPAAGYNYLQAFDALTGAKGLPFLADLPLESSTKAEHECRFIQRMRLTEFGGAYYVLEATLAVTPITPSDAAAQAIVDAYPGA